MDDEAVVATLSRVGPFRDLSSQALQRIAGIAGERDVPAGQHVYFAGDLATEFYVIVSGCVQAFIPATGGEVHIGLIQPGQIFGEMAMLDGGPRIATAIALDHTELLEIKRDPWLGLIRQGAVSSEVIFIALGHSLRTYAQHAIDFLFLDIDLPDAPPPSLSDSF
jgi:CRP/FNR family cyclic AMP-dependent transcriptional regulator